MKRQPKPRKIIAAPLEEFIIGYEPAVLHAAISSFENSTGWNVLLAYINTVQRRYEVDALDLIGKGNQAPAAYASGYAKALEDMKTFPEGVKQTILGIHVTEMPLPEE